MGEQYLVPIDAARTCTRRHAIKVFAAAAGGAVLGGPLLRPVRAAPWGESPDSTLLTEQTQRLAAERGWPYESLVRQDYPTLTMEPDGARIWTSWTRAVEGIERIWLRPFATADSSWGELYAVSLADAPGSAAYQSEVAWIAGRIVVVWSEFGGTGWTIRTRALEPSNGTMGEIARLDGSGAGDEFHTRPAVAVVGSRLLVVWQRKLAGAATFDIAARWLTAEGTPAGEPFTIGGGEGRDGCRPAVAAAPDGRNFAVAFDRQDRPGTQNVYVVLGDAETGARSEPLAVSGHPASDLAPALAYAPDGEWLWVGWHSNRRGDDGWDIPRWYRLRALRLRDRVWHRPRGGVPAGNLEKRGTDQGFEFVRLAVSPAGTVCVLGRPSHNFCLQYFGREESSPVYRLPADGWGGRGRWLRGAFDPAGRLWVTRRDLERNVVQRIDGFDTALGAPALEPDPPSGGDALQPLAGIHRVYAWPARAAEAEASELSLYFGDLHGHSWQSDGMGDPEESFLRARDVFHDDFHALTDHDRFVGKRVMDAQWQEQKDLVEHYHAPNAFVTLFAQEWTTPRIDRPHGWGHYNVYSADRRLPLFDHEDPQYRDLPGLLEALKGLHAIAIPHHIGWTGVRWDTWDAEVVPAVEVCSVHGAYEYEGNEPIRHRGGIKGSFVRDGLAAGLRFGFVGGSDQHGLIWQHGVCWKRDAYRAGLTGVWAPRLTRDEILAALRARRTFATTGVKLCLRFTIERQMMGACVTASAPPTIRVDVAVPPEEGTLGWLQIVRDGAVIHQYGGEAQRSQYTVVDEQCPPRATSCYYLRVILADRNMAWSSPIWVTRT